MESPTIENIELSDVCESRLSSTTTTNSNQSQFSTDNIVLPDDTFRMSLDDLSLIGENITVGERGMSIDSNAVQFNIETPGNDSPNMDTLKIDPTNIETLEIDSPNIETLEIDSPNIETPGTDTSNMETPVIDTPYIVSPKIGSPIIDSPAPIDLLSQNIIETPKRSRTPKETTQKSQNLIRLTFSKKNENDVFVKPSPVSEGMSPAKMLQFEVDFATSSTPTMKRAAIDFDFFTKANLEKYFKDIPEQIDEEVDIKDYEDTTNEKTYEETPVIVKADTVRHEIGYETDA